MFSICIGCYVFTAFIFQTTPKWILEFFVYTYTGLVQQHITSNKVFNSFHKFCCSPKLRFFDKQELSKRQIFAINIIFILQAYKYMYQAWKGGSGGHRMILLLLFKPLFFWTENVHSTRKITILKCKFIALLELYKSFLT